jgi:hypothetical protein
VDDVSVSAYNRSPGSAVITGNAVRSQAATPIGGYLKSSLREALVGRVFWVVDMSQCSIWVFDRDSQYLNGISGAPFLLLVLGMKRSPCLDAWIAADQGRG